MARAARSEKNDVGVVLVAAGSAARFGRKKQFLELAGKPMLLHGLETLGVFEEVVEIAVVVASVDVEEAESLLSSRGVEERIGARVSVVVGGASRQASVANGMAALEKSIGWVLVHDAARPLLRQHDARRCIDTLLKNGSAVLGHRVADSVKEIAPGRIPRIQRDVPRAGVWLVQTPQGASRQVLEEALLNAARDGVAVMDEASLLERANVQAVLVEGARDNIKVTYPDDLALAEFLLAQRERNGA